MVNRKRKIVLVVHNVRSAHNVGSILRSADGLGVETVYLTGYTPYPVTRADKRLPHIAKSTAAKITKTALGAEKSIKWRRRQNLPPLIEQLKKAGFLIVALEQTQTANNISRFKSAKDVALIVGSEIGGIESDLLELTDECLEIPMAGVKESLNVSIAAAIALYHLRYIA